MKILNLGCGLKTSPDTINIDRSIYFRIRNNRLFFALGRFFLRGYRLKNLCNLPKNILIHDLSKGIPYPAGSVDVVYHSHLLEHIDRDKVEGFLGEIHRVLKRGGILRIVVPDFEICCREYVDHLALCGTDEREIEKHDNYIYEIVGKTSFKEAPSTSNQPPFMRFMENLILGDARKRGIPHQWMYDRFNLPLILKNTGFCDIHIHQYNDSYIPRWNDIGLDLDDQGGPYRPKSLYVEAYK